MCDENRIKTMYFLWILYFLRIVIGSDSKLSLISPFGSALIENWDLYGSVEIQQNKIILISPLHQPKVGSIWSKHKNIYEE